MSRVEVNSPRLLFSAVLLGLVGPQALMVQPAFVDGLVSQLGFDASQAGFVAASENTGKAVSSLAMMALISRVSWRTLYYCALSALIVGNVVCAFLDSYEAFRVVRFFTGAATGVIVPLCYVVIGLTAKADRNFGIMLTAILCYAALVFSALPSVFDAIGFTGLVVFFAAVSTLGLFVVPNMPTSGEERREGGAPTTLPWRHRGMALAAMFLYFVGMFAVWVYLSLIGKDAGIGDQQVGNALTLAQFFGIAGAFSVVAMGDRFGRAWPLGVSIGGTIAALAILANYQTALGFTIAACGFNMFWNVTHPYLLGAQASFDRSGRQVTYAVAMQMLGVAAGPALAAWIVGGGSYDQVIVIAGVALGLCLMLIEPPVIRQAR